MSFLVEPALSGLFKILFQKINSPEFLVFARLHRVQAEVYKWLAMLTTLRDVLEDAEQKQMSSTAVKGWLEDLQHLALDVEDFLDGFSYDILRREVKAAKNQPPDKLSMAKNIPPDFVSGYTPKSILFKYKVSSKLKKITRRLQELTDKRRQFDLFEIAGAGSSRTVWSRAPSSSVPHEPVFVGRDEEKRRISDLLMRHEQGDPSIGVIPITGMGGLGKTTLARLVYNDDEVKGSFEKLAWVCVSQDFDITRITRGILEAVTAGRCGFSELALIQAKLHEALVGKKFLLVIDDLWNDNSEDWDRLRSPWMHGAAGSKVIVTTRLGEVADMIRTVAYEPLSYMSDDQCWSIFCRHAFDWNGNSPANSRYEEIGRQIVRKCSGLPLAAMVLGGLLRSKEREEDWEFVLNNKSWNFKYGKVDVLSVLRMSYYDLPSHLKRCFAHCAIFPEDFRFEEDELVFLWMAEGLVQPSQGGEDEMNMEDLGRNYFRGLVSRSLFSPYETNGSVYVMHDLIHDLSVEVAGATCYKVGKDAHLPNQVVRERARHCAFVPGRMKEFNFLRETKLLRSILPFPWDGASLHDDEVHNAIIAMLSKLKYLRVFSLHASQNQMLQLPESVGNLIHLKFIDLSFAEIKNLPSSITLLYNLQTLILKGCYHLQKLPQDIGNLISLYRLDISDTYLNELPLGIMELKNLGRLSNFVVGKGPALAVIASLGNLKFLRGRLHISKLENVTSAEDAKSAALCHKKKLEALSLEWSSGQSSDANDGDVLEGLQPHRNLKKLSIQNCRGASIPSWLDNMSMLQEIIIENCSLMLGSLPLFATSLKKLVVSRCPQLLVSLPRLPELSELQIRYCKEVDCTEDASFDKLRMLEFSNITNMTPLVQDKVFEWMKHLKSLALAADCKDASCISYGFPSCKLEGLPLVAYLMMNGQPPALAQMKLEYLKFSRVSKS